MKKIFIRKIFFCSNNYIFNYMNGEKKFNISICSYNLFWEVMNNYSSPLEKKIGKDNLDKLKENILKNIFFIKNYYNPFVYCFQESAAYTDVINIFEKNKYDFYVGKSGPENILTIWNLDVLKKKKIFDGEFELGRPFTIIIFKDIRFDSYFILVNIHSGHNQDTSKSIFDPIQKIIIANKNIINKFNIKRIIISGDFNRDISSEIIGKSNSNDNIINNNMHNNDNNNNYQLIVNSSIYNFYPFVSNNKTCCSLNGYGYKKNYDQVIDSYDTPIVIHPMTKEKWYESKSSDHVAILSIVKNI